MFERLAPPKLSDVFKRALADGIIGKDDTAAVFYDLSGLTERIKELQTLFPSNTLHAIAIKANPIVGILNKLNDPGVGAEAASLPELFIAQKSGFTSDRIVFDSPAKTRDELEYALKNGVHINIDSFEELAIVADIRSRIDSSSTFGLRLNPQVGTGGIKSTGVAGDYSKFGIPLKPNWSALLKAYSDFEWLRGVHLHIGSQGCSLELLVTGVKTVLDFADDVNSKVRRAVRSQAIDIFDIGGGLPVAYRDSDKPPSLEEYISGLKGECPRLFDGRFKLITEFGRYIHANIGWAISRVEYVKSETTPPTLITHLGADMFIRECYNPDDWHHDMTVLSPDGELKSGNTKIYMVAGPLCFAGDMLARNIVLPEIQSGDYLVIHDIGAYTLSMWSRYNSRALPKVIGYHNGGEKFELIKDREALDDIYNFWR